MPAVINTNIASLNAQRNLNASQSSLNTSIQRLSSGLRINSAKDDAAGLAISERMTSQIRGLNQATRNANDGISLSQTAEGALGEAGNILQRVRELAVQSANATNSASDRAALQAEVSQLTSELDRIATTTEFNGTKLLDGSFTAQQFQVGANANQTIGVTVDGARATQLGSVVNTAGTRSVTVTPTQTLTNATDALTKTSFTGVDNTAITVGELSINGIEVKNSAQFSTTKPGQTAESAYAKAAAVNASNISGVTAIADNTQSWSAVAGSTAGTNDGIDITAGDTDTVAYKLEINGSAVIDVASVADTSIDSLVTSINAFKDTTGVVASKTSTGALQLRGEDGRDVKVKESFTLADSAGTALTNVKSVFSSYAEVADGASSAVSEEIYRGQVTLQSSSNITFNSSAASQNLGYDTTLLSPDTTKSIATVDISSVAGANAAILAADAALTSVNSNRAKLGAVQSRFDSTISNLQTTSENLSGARSRIKDADFAAETAMLTRGQILQQAGTAMLAQANSLPNNVLSLLR
ncbi:MAG: flagellin [Thiobacillus sp.]|nr:flagellin [Thiobacillus sp.]